MPIVSGIFKEAIELATKRAAKRGVKKAVMSEAERNAILNQIFTEGIESVDEKTIKKLFQAKGSKLYRHDFDPERLAKVGFKKGTTHYKSQAEKNFYTQGQSGIYYTKRPHTIPEVLDLKTGLVNDDTNVIGLRKPGSKAFIEQPVDPEGMYTKAKEVIQTEPNNVLAKIKTGKNKSIYRILGIGGAATAIGLNQDEVEANPMESALAKKLIKAVESSASKVLKGTKFKNKIIQSIKKGEGDWRYIITSDGEAELVDKKVINALAREVGTAKKIAQFETKNVESKLAQAFKSLNIHKNKAIGGKKEVVDYFNNYKKQLSIAGKEVPKMSLVESEGKTFTMPKPYADILHKENVIKKLKDL